MIKPPLRSTRGFTLMEFLVSMALMSLFLLVLTDLMTGMLSLQTESDATSSIIKDGRYIMQRFDYDINRATSVTTPAALGGSGATLAIIIGGVTHTYSVSAGSLQVVNNLGTINLDGAGSTISGFSVQRLGDVGGKDTVRITFTATSVALRNGVAETRTFTTTVGRR